MVQSTIQLLIRSGCIQSNNLKNWLTKCQETQLQKFQTRRSGKQQKGWLTRLIPYLVKNCASLLRVALSRRPSSKFSNNSKPPLPPKKRKRNEKKRRKRPRVRHATSLSGLRRLNRRP